MHQHVFNLIQDIFFNSMIGSLQKITREWLDTFEIYRIIKKPSIYICCQKRREASPHFNNPLGLPKLQESK